MSGFPPVLALSPALAAEGRRALVEEHFDVLVIGGGVVGAGAALDAATRGLSVAIVEAEDWAAGTSSRSSKLIHGGLRYVQTREFSLVREALRERALLLRLAPHLVRPERFLYPLRHRIERPYVGAGIALYDLLARVREGSPAPRGRHLGARAARAAAPALRRGRIAGAVTYFDAQVDDARFVLELVRTAVSYGAHAVSRARVVALTEEANRVTGARIRFAESGDEVLVRARSVVGAVGACTEDVAAMAGSHELRLRPSKGVHVLVPRELIDSTTALIIPTRRSVLFVLPWGVHWLIGTTDTPWEHDRAQPVATQSDIDYLLSELNAVLSRPIGRGAIESVYVGLRPLVDGAAGSTTKLSREHAVVVPRAGLALVAGGKFTTYRVMAKDVLDAALESAGIEGGPCRTDVVPLAGAVGLDDVLADRSALATKSGLALADIDHLLGRYGALAPEVIDAGEQAGAEGRLAAAPGYLAAEVVYAVTHEGARHLDDVLVRRLRASIETSDRALGAAPEVGRLMAPLLGWSDQQLTDELTAFRELTELELRAEQLPDDDAAARLLATRR